MKKLNDYLVLCNIKGLLDNGFIVHCCQSNLDKSYSIKFDDFKDYKLSDTEISNLNLITSIKGHYNGVPVFYAERS